MKVNTNCQNSTNPYFKGRMQQYSEIKRGIFRMIDNMSPYVEDHSWGKIIIEKNLRNKELNKSLKEIENEYKKLTLIERLKQRSSYKQRKENLEKNIQNKTLKDYWNETLENVTNTVKTKLSDEYVLRWRKNTEYGENSGPMSFSITKGEEFIYGVSASINDPKFPEKLLEKTVKILSSPKFKKTFDNFKEIIPELTENGYVMSFGNFSNANILKLKIYNKLKQKTAEKNLSLSMRLIKNEYVGYRKATAVLKNQNNEVVYKISSDFENVVNGIEDFLTN